MSALFDPPPREVAVENRDAVNSGLLRLHLRLSDRHRQRLRARGLPDAEIARNGYASTPAARHERERVAAAALSPYLEAFAPHGGVPGFYKAGGRWRMVYCAAGFYIPIRDERGRVRGLQDRADNPGSGAKYLWLSSNPDATDERGRVRYQMAPRRARPSTARVMNCSARPKSCSSPRAV